MSSHLMIGGRAALPGEPYPVAPDPKFLCSECGGNGIVVFGHPNDPSSPEGDCPKCDGNGAICEYCGEPIDLQTEPDPTDPRNRSGFYVAPNGDPCCRKCAEAEDWD